MTRSKALRLSAVALLLGASGYFLDDELHLSDEVRCRLGSAATDSALPSHWKMHVIDDTGNGADGVHVADINQDGFADVVSGWEQSGEIKLYLNPYAAAAQPKADAQWQRVAVSGGLTTKGIEDAAFADMNLDGQLDSILSSAEGSTRSLGVHWLQGPVASAASWRGTRLVPAQQSSYLKARAGQIDGINGADVVAGTKEKGAEQAGVYWFKAPPTAGPEGAAQWQRFFVGHVDFKTTTLLLRDMNADGRLDVLYSGRAGIGWFKNPGAALEQPWPRVVVSEQDSEFALCDVNGDGLLDVVAGASRHTPIVARWYKQLDASGEHWQPFEIATAEGRPGFASGVKFVIKGVGCLPDPAQQWPRLVFTASGYGHGLFELTTRAAPEAEKPWHIRNLTAHQCGMKYDNVEMVDVDRDGDLDAVTTEEGEGVLTAGTGVIWFENPAVP